MLRCVALLFQTLAAFGVCCRVLQSVAGCCRVLQGVVAGCCSAV